MILSTIKRPIGALSVFLLSTSAFLMPASATPLPDITPDQIRQDTQSRFNPETGEREFIAPDFDPFELDETLAGSASLRSAGQAITIEGRQVSGGAFLDISLFYTTGSNDSYDTRGTERGIYVSGQPVDTIRYDSKILECSENTREVVYDNSYYSGASYGYLAGVYRQFPRYRGHRNFGHHRGNGYRAGYSGRHTRHNDGFRDGRAGHAGQGGTNRGRHNDRVTASNDRNTSADTRPENGTLVTLPGSRLTNSNNDHTQNLSVKERRHLASRRNNRHNLKDPKRHQSGSSGGKDVRTQPVQPRRTVKSPTPERARPVPARTEKAPKRVRTERLRSTRDRSTLPKRERSNVSRSVDKHFGRTSKNRSRGLTKNKLNFYPMQIRGYTRSDVSVSFRCAREEMVTLHIPQDRLDAARFEGFTVLLLDRAGEEIPVFVPPNYVEGFRQAAGRVSYQAPAPAVQGYQRPEALQSAPVRDPSEPIVYGETGR